MTDITMIALSKLVESEENVRKTNRKDGIGQLAQSIKAHSLLQSLVVRATDGGKFAVIAGGRRLRALRLLARAGDIDKHALIPCRIIGSEESATELSLAENTIRLDMNLADEIVAIASEEVSLNRLFPGRQLKTTEPAPGTYRTWRRSTSPRHPSATPTS